MTHTRTPEEIAAQAEKCAQCEHSIHPEACKHAYKRGGCSEPHLNEK